MTAHQHVASDLLGLIRRAYLSRRRFMTASAAAAAGYTLAAGPVRANPITTSAEGLDTGTATIETSEGAMPAYYAKPTGVRNPPIILVCMEVFGLHAYIKDVTRRLAKLGAFAIAPDYYFKLGDLTKISDIKELIPLVNSKADSELIADLDATVRWGKSQGGDSAKLGILGFCRGGRTVWVYCAANPDVKAGVAFYGSLVDPEAQRKVWPKSPIELAADMKAPVLGLYGGDDQGIPPAQVDMMKAALAAAGKTAEFKIYPGAPHGFHADYRPSYHAEAAKDAWIQAENWFKRWSVLP
ncbi:dienelactone hydrolase family protein [Hyphomicrobium sp.]|uniref:dienelactone hydrolase family protein n=1 Tax=Hyphomicrobium sp. TaxID=82 RepID=UPI000FC2E947|nr:dienelactone hydrolase family protein [Hyphomicrobium sp.]RUP08071.1 MAG: dienelactone hydrolase family protein [Hyphomicrobium sp.]